MNIIGINSVYHESSVCLISNNRVIACVEEERFNRIKHAKKSKISNAHELPINALKYCLSKGHLDLSDIDIIGYSLNPLKRYENSYIKDVVNDYDYGSEYGERTLLANVYKIPNLLNEMGFKGRFEWIEHGLAHAASAYYASPFSDAAIISIDGIGETDSLTLAFGEGSGIRVISKTEYPNSIGFLWEKFCLYLGYTEYDACKVMSLASFGKPSKYKDEFDKIVKINNGYNFEIDNDILMFRKNDFSQIEKLFNLKKVEPGEKLKSDHYDIASTLQEVTNNFLISLADHLYSATGSTNVTMAGGVALNCVANRIMFERSNFDNIYIQPAANDAGTALGAALYLNCILNNHRPVLDSIYLGPEFSDEEVVSILAQYDLKYSFHNDIEVETAKLLSKGKVCSWFQGRMEFGPRALGNRSILADPRSIEMKDRINSIVKHRELYRPFCPSVLTSEADKWFEIDKDAIASEYMLMAYPVKEEKKKLIPAVLHIDDTARIQKVKKEKNRKFHKLIECFFNLTGVPMLLNTSFNDNEPIVCTPHEAIETFLNTDIDCIVINNYLIKKNE